MLILMFCCFAYLYRFIFFLFQLHIMFFLFVSRFNFDMISMNCSIVR